MYGSTSRLAMRSTSASNSVRPSSSLLDMFHEAMRQQIAEAKLVARFQPLRARAFRVRAKRLDGLPQLRHALAGRRLGLDDRRPPLALAKTLQGQVRLDRGHRAIGAVAIALVDDEDVRDLHDAGLERLHVVAGPGHEHDDRDVGGADDINLVLADADGFDDHEALAGGIEHERGITRRPRKAAHVTTRRHAADEDLIVLRVRLHAHAVAENRAAGERARRIDRNHPDGLAGVAGFGRQPIDERALAGAGRSGHANEVGPAGVRKDVADQARRGVGLVFDQRDGAGHRPHVAGSHALGQ